MSIEEKITALFNDSRTNEPVRATITTRAGLMVAQVLPSVTEGSVLTIGLWGARSTPGHYEYLGIRYTDIIDIELCKEPYGVTEIAITKSSITPLYESTLATHLLLLGSGDIDNVRYCQNDYVGLKRITKQTGAIMAKGRDIVLQVGSKIIFCTLLKIDKECYHCQRIGPKQTKPIKVRVRDCKAVYIAGDILRRPIEGLVMNVEQAGAFPYSLEVSRAGLISAA